MHSTVILLNDRKTDFQKIYPFSSGLKLQFQHQKSSERFPLWHFLIDYDFKNISISEKSLKVSYMFVVESVMWADFKHVILTARIQHL